MKKILILVPFLVACSNAPSTQNQIDSLTVQINMLNTEMRGLIENSEVKAEKDSFIIRKQIEDLELRLNKVFKKSTQE